MHWSAKSLKEDRYYEAPCSNAATRFKSSTHSNLSYICPGKAYVVGIAPRANVTDVSVWKAFLQEHRFKETSFAVNSL